jgi:type I restriction enzyme M protein
LPLNLFYNTGIATYVWVLSNRKAETDPRRAGKVQLIDATSFWTKLRKNLGAKGREVGADDRERILKLYDDFAETEHSKILEATEFGYWTITVERPVVDDNGRVVTDTKGRPKPDTKLRDTENVPFTYPGGIDAYVKSEVLPYVPDAWIDEKKTKVGYEIPFTRHFYTYVPPRPLAEIDADLDAQVAKILALLREVEK